MQNKIEHKGIGKAEKHGKHDFMDRQSSVVTTLPPQKVQRKDE
jgi:hypothetical protein